MVPRISAEPGAEPRMGRWGAYLQAGREKLPDMIASDLLLVSPLSGIAPEVSSVPHTPGLQCGELCKVFFQFTENCQPLEASHLPHRAFLMPEHQPSRLLFRGIGGGQGGG